MGPPRRARCGGLLPAGLVRHNDPTVAVTTRLALRSSLVHPVEPGGATALGADGPGSPASIQPGGEAMALEYNCPSCNQTFRETTAEALIKRAAAHNHEHHGGPEEITPELEAAVRGSTANA